LSNKTGRLQMIDSVNEPGPSGKLSNKTGRCQCSPGP